MLKEKCKKMTTQIVFFKSWRIGRDTTLILLRISPRSFLAWFWSIFFLTFFDNFLVCVCVFVCVGFFRIKGAKH